MKLSSIDMNLLVALDALVEERSVTRAGERVGLSQPAMSSALGRLRDLLDDPVLVRSGNEMLPTERAMELAGRVHEALSIIEDALRSHRGAFDPRSAERVFRIAATDYVEFVLLPPLLRRIQESAPGIELEIKSFDGGRVWEPLRRGELDFAISYFREVPSGANCAEIFEEVFVSVVRGDHPVVGDELDRETFASLPHVLISPRGGRDGVVDRRLSEHGLSRKVVVTVPHFLTVPLLVSETDVVVTLARRLAQRFERVIDLKLLEPPIELEAFPVHMVWHRRYERDGAHRWMRGVLAEIGGGL